MSNNVDEFLLTLNNSTRIIDQALAFPPNNNYARANQTTSSKTTQNVRSTNATQQSIQQFLTSHEKRLSQRRQLFEYTVKDLTYKHLQQRINILQQNAIESIQTKATSDLMSLMNDPLTYYKDKMNMNAVNKGLFEELFQTIMNSQAFRMDYHVIDGKLYMKSLFDMHQYSVDGSKYIRASNLNLYLSVSGDNIIMKYVHNGMLKDRNQLLQLTADQRNKIEYDTFLYLQTQHKDLFDKTSDLDAQYLISSIVKNIKES